MKRRTLLQGGAVGGVAGLAGIGYIITSASDSGSDANSNDGPTEPSTTTSEGSNQSSGSASFTDVQIRVPDDVSVGEEFTITITVTNDGDDSGTFTDTLTVTGPLGDEHTKQVEIDGVAPGETGSTNISVSGDLSADYTATLAETNATAKFHVDTALNPEEAVPLGDDLTFTMDGGDVTPGLILEGDGPYYLEGPVPKLLPAENPAKNGLGYIIGTVANTGDRPKTIELENSPFTMVSNTGEEPSFYTDMAREIYPGIPVAAASTHIGEEPLDGTEIPPGKSQTGWLLAPVNWDDLTSEGATYFGIEREGRPGPAVSWQLGYQDGVHAPVFEAKNLVLPEEITNGEPAEFSVTVTNTGRSAGTFRGVLETEVIIGEWAPVGRVVGEDISPSETVELTGEFFTPWRGRHPFRLQGAAIEPDDDVKKHYAEQAEAECRGRSVQLGYGEEITLPNGVTVLLRQPHFVNGYYYTRDEGVADDSLLVKASASLPEWARGEGLGKKMLPNLEDFAIRASDEFRTLEPFRVGDEDLQAWAASGGNTIDRPIQGPLYPIEPPADPSNGMVEGWVELWNIQGLDNGWPNEKREAVLQIPLKRTEDNADPVFGAVWSQKFE